jgi:DNA invertase Pin-like site-specific DNA recombinase
MTCEALRASNFSWTMECWATATGGIRLTTTNTRAPMPVEDEPTGNDLDDAIRDYVRTHVLWHGRRKTMEKFGVSRHTLWRCLERGRLGNHCPGR